MRLVIRDAKRDIHANRHYSEAHAAVAALDAEPETIEDLDLALERFRAPRQGGVVGGFSPGLDDRPYDSGLVVIDLAARLVLCDATSFAASRIGSVRWHDGQQATEIAARYVIADDWQFMDDALAWEGQAEHRRRERLANPPLDARPILYGAALLDFIMKSCWEAFREPSLAARDVIPAMRSADAATAEAARTRAKALDAADDILVTQIHARWLTTPRDDLHGRSPRDVLLERMDFIGRCLEGRCQQWSQQGHCPRPLDAESAAYRFGGFGRHENVVYYEMVRGLINRCHDGILDLAEAPDGAAVTCSDFMATEKPRLIKWQKAWLDAPNHEFSGRTPHSIIDNERLRIPEAMSQSEAIFDDDCPLCQMNGEFGPTFWFLDGSGMDEGFVFSFHRTLEEWEQEQREYEEINAKYEAERAAGKLSNDQMPWDDDKFTVIQGGDMTLAFAAPGPDDNPAMAGVVGMFKLGALLGDVITGLRKPPDQAGPTVGDSAKLVDKLKRDFDNLRDILGQQDAEASCALLEPVVAGFQETLHAVSSARPDLADRVERLTSALDQMLSGGL